MDDLISRQKVMKLIRNSMPEETGAALLYQAIAQMPAEVKAISYQDCQNALLKMWMDNVVTDGEYRRISAKLIAIQEEKDG